MAEELLADAERHLGRALDALEQAKAEVPAYAVESMRFLRAEIKTVNHRLRSCRKAVRDSGRQSA